MNDFAELAFMETPLIDAAGFMELILRFVLNMVVVVAIIRFFYYPKSRRRDYKGGKTKRVNMWSA